MAGDRSRDATLYIDRSMRDVEECALAIGQVATFSTPAPGRDRPNQDAAAVIPLGGDAAVLAVADGLGGERSGARAAALAVRGLARALAGREPDAPLRAAILDGFDAANRAVCELGVGAGTTLAVLAIEEGWIRSYHVGDSCVLVFGQRGRIKFQTVSHSPVGFGVEAGLIDEMDALHHEDRHVVSNVLGSPDMRIEIGPRRRLATRDTALLASDGLFDNLHTEEIVAQARVGPLGPAAHGLANLALQRMLEPAVGEPSKPDDLTFVMFRPGRR